MCPNCKGTLVLQGDIYVCQDCPAAFRKGDHGEFRVVDRPEPAPTEPKSESTEVDETTDQPSSEPNPQPATIPEPEPTKKTGLQIGPLHIEFDDDLSN